MADKTNKELQSIFMRVGKTTLKYGTGVAKSFLASGKEMLDNYTPNIMSTIDTNKEFFSDAIKFLRNPVDTFQKGIDRAVGSEAYKELKKTAQYALEDLKSGEWYDKDRTRNSSLAEFDELLDFELDDSFGGVDFGDFDENGDYVEEAESSADDDKNRKVDIEIAKMQEEGSYARTGATIDAITNSTTAIIQTERYNSQTQLRMQMKQHAQQMNALQNMLTTQGATLNLINSGINASLELSREMHTQYMKELGEIKNLLTDIKKNTTPPERKQIEAKNAETDVFDSSGVINIRNFFKNIFRNMDNQFSVKSMASMMTGGMSMADFIQKFQDNPLQLITDQLLSSMIPEKFKKQMQRTDKNLGSFFPALLTKAAERGKNFSESGSLLDLVLGLVGVNTRSNKQITTMRPDMLQPATFTNKFVTAVEEVIPMWLSRIDSHISGMPMEVYNYSTGRLEKVRNVISSTVDRTSNLVKRMGESGSEFIERSKVFQFDNSDKQRDWERYARTYLQDQLENGRFINPKVSFEEFAKNAPSSGANTADDMLYKRLIYTILNYMPNSQLMSMSLDMHNARAGRNRDTANINNELFRNGTIAAFAGFEDSELTKRIDAATRKELNTLDDKTLAEIQSKRSSDIVKRGGVGATNYILQDILHTLKKGIITYSYNLGSADAASASDLLRYVFDARDQTNNIEQTLRRYVEDEKARHDKLMSRQHESAVENMTQGLIEHDPTRYYVNARTDDYTLAQIQDAFVRKNLDEFEIDNEDVTNTEPLTTAQVRANQEKIKGYVSDAKNKVKNVAQSKGVYKFYQMAKDAVDFPLQVMDGVMKGVDRIMFRVLYGKQAAEELDWDADDNSIMALVSKTTFGLFGRFADSFKTSILNPIQSWLFDKEKGIITKIENTFTSKIVDPVKNKVKDVKDKLSEKYRGTYDEETKRWSGGKFSEQINKVKDRKDSIVGSAKVSFKNAINRLLYGDNVLTKGVRWDVDEADYNDETGQIEYTYKKGGYSGVIGTFKKGFDNVKEWLFGPEGEDTDSKKDWQKVAGVFKEAYPDMIIGGGIGLVSSLFLPGGPLLGTILGAGTGLVAGSETLKKYLFGDLADEMVPDPDNPGQMKPSGKKSRTGGLISKQVIDGVKQYAPGAAIGGFIGHGIGGKLLGGLLPGAMGPILGTMFGAMGGITASSKEFKKILFGDGVDEKSGIISKEFRKKFVDKVKELAPSTATGAASGALIGKILGGGLGLIPGLSLLPTGPIFGFLGGAVGMANADKFNKFLFGEEVEVDEEQEVDDPDHPGQKKKVKTGKKIKKREGGVFHSMYETVKNKVVTPIGDKINKAGEGIANWFKKDVLGPLKNASKALSEKLHESFEKMISSITGVGDKVTGGILKAMGIVDEKTGQDISLGDFIKQKVMNPLKEKMDKLFSGVGKLIGNILSAPFKLIEFLATGTIDGKTADDIRNDRQAKRQERIDKRNAKRAERMRKNRQRRYRKIGGVVGRNAERLDRYTREAGETTRDYFYRLFHGHKRKESSTSTSTTEAADADTTSSSTQAPDVVDVPVDANGNPVVSDVVSQTATATTESNAQPTSSTTTATATVKPRKKKDDKPSEESVESSSKDEEATRESNKKKIKPRKSSNEYLAIIAKHTGNIASEIKGQIGGVGWNTAYIKTLLEVQFGRTLSDDELPEEMEGSTRNVRKRRGFFGKMKDKVSGFFGGIGDKVGGVVDKIKDTVMAPFRILGGVLDGVVRMFQGFGDMIGNAISKIPNLIEGIFKMLGKAANVILDGVQTITSVLFDATRAIGTVITDGIMSLSSLISGAFEVASYIIPDVVAGLWEGGKAIGKGLWKGVKTIGKGGLKVAKGIGKGVAKGFKSITGKFKSWRENRKIKKNIKNGVTDGPLGTMNHNIEAYVTGGTIDAINSINDQIIPTVRVVNGLAMEPITQAVPVYLVGAGNEATIYTKNSPDLLPGDNDNTGGENPEENPSKLRARVARIKRNYRSIDQKAEKSKKPGDVYDKAIENARTPEEIEDIKTAQQLNSGSLMITAGSQQEEKKKSSFTEFFESIFGGEGSSISSLLTTFLSGSSIGRLLLSKAQAGKSILGSGISSLGKTLLKNAPFLIGTKQAMDNGEYDRVGTNVAKQSIKVGKYFSTGAAAASGAISATQMLASSADDIGKVAIKNGGNVFSKIITFVRNCISKLFKSKTVAAILKKFGKADTDKIASTVLSHFDDALKKLGSEAAQKFLSKLNIIVTVATAVYDFASGMHDACEYFKIDAGDVTIGMRLAAGLAKAISGIAFGLLPVAWLAGIIYKLFANKETEDELKEKQDKLKQKTAEYNQANGTSLSVDEYIDSTHDSIWDKIKKGATSVKDKVHKFFNPTVYTDENGKEYSMKELKKHIEEQNTLAEQSGETGKGPATRIAVNDSNASAVSDPFKIGKGIAAALIEKMEDILHSKKSSPAIFSLIGEGLGSAFVSDMKATDGKNASLASSIAGASYVALTDTADNTSFWGKTKNKISSLVKSGVSRIKKFLGFGSGPGLKAMSQKNAKYNRGSNNMALSGCGPTAAAMVANAYGANGDPMEASAMSYGLGMRASDGGTNPDFFSQYGNAKGFGMSKGPVDGGLIGSSLRHGQPVVMMGKGGSFGNNMHYMVADGITGSKVSLADPLTGTHKSSDMSSLIGHTADSIYSFGKGPATKPGEVNYEDAEKVKQTAADMIDFTFAGDRNNLGKSRINKPQKNKSKAKIIDLTKKFGRGGSTRGKYGRGPQQPLAYSDISGSTSALDPSAQLEKERGITVFSGPELICAIAFTQVGVKEIDGTNDVLYNTEYYGGRVHDTKDNSYPWCCAFVWWVFKHAGLSSIFGNKTASCGRAVTNLQAVGGVVIPHDQAQPGDLVFYNKSGGGYSHIGIVVRPSDGSTVGTVEGNAGNGVTHSDSVSIKDKTFIHPAYTDDLYRFDLSPLKSAAAAWIGGNYNVTAAESSGSHAGKDPNITNGTSPTASVVGMSNVANTAAAASVTAAVPSIASSSSTSSYSSYSSSSNNYSAPTYSGGKTADEVIGNLQSFFSSITTKADNLINSFLGGSTSDSEDDSSTDNSISSFSMGNRSTYYDTWNGGDISSSSSVSVTNPSNPVYNPPIVSPTGTAVDNATSMFGDATSNPVAPTGFEGVGFGKHGNSIYDDAWLDSNVPKQFDYSTSKVITGSDNAKYLFNYLKSMGMSDVASAAVLGNIYAESGVIPGNLENSGETKYGINDKDFTAALNNGTMTLADIPGKGYGIAQWTSAGRKDKLTNFRNLKGAPFDDMAMQSEFLYNELYRDYSKVFNTINAMDDIGRAAGVVVRKFEIPGSVNPDYHPDLLNDPESLGTFNKRAGYAKGYYDLYASKPSTSSSTTEYGSGPGFNPAKINKDMNDLFGKGGATGASFNVEALNQQIQNSSNVMSKINEEESTASDVASITNKITKAINDVTSNSDDSVTGSASGDAMLRAIASGLGEVVKILSDIKTNTASIKDIATVAGEGGYGNNSDGPNSYANSNDYLYGNDVGSSIIDKLTAK